MTLNGFCVLSRQKNKPFLAWLMSYIFLASYNWFWKYSMMFLQCLIIPIYKICDNQWNDAFWTDWVSLLTISNQITSTYDISNNFWVPLEGLLTFLSQNQFTICSIFVSKTVRPRKLSKNIICKNHRWNYIIHEKQIRLS